MDEKEKKDMEKDQIQIDESVTNKGGANASYSDKKINQSEKISDIISRYFDIIE